MKTVQGVQVFTIADIIGDPLSTSPDEAEKAIVEWCERNGAMYGKGCESSIVEVATGVGQTRVVIAEL